MSGLGGGGGACHEGKKKKIVLQVEINHKELKHTVETQFLNLQGNQKLVRDIRSLNFWGKNFLQ